MLKAKQNGGNQALMYDATASETLRGRLNIESTMREDIEKGAFQVYVQPLTSAQTGQIKSAEALVRWQRGGELVSPARFIPVAENSGLIVELGELVLDKVCQQVQLWLSQGIEVVPVAVNVSIIQFIRSDIVATLSRLLERYQVPAHYIEIEITESSMSDNVAELKQALSAIKQLGVRLAIDDFGTGFSSLSYLKSLPVDKLKIDRSFIQDLMQNKQSRNIVASVVKLAHDLELEVVSEGVEDELTLQQLRNMRVDTIQGYIISRPFPLAQLCDFHQQHQQQLA